MSYIKLWQPLLIFVLVIAIIMIVLRRYPVIRKNPVLDKLDKQIIFGLSLLYGLISFYYFGQTNNFGSWQVNSVAQKLSIQFSEPVHLAKLYYFYGKGDGNLVLDYHTVNDKNVRQPFKNEWGFYKWQSMSLPSDELIDSIDVKADLVGIELKQLAFFDANDQLLNNFSLSSTDNDLEQIKTVVVNKLPVSYDNTYLSSTFFDEIFYARTAYEYLHGLPPYSWVHPPLGMLLIAIGIIFCGMSPFGWRLIPNLGGIIMIGVIYLFAKRLFNSRQAAIFTNLLLMLEFMHFTMSRMASIDSSVTLFILCEYYFLLCYFQSKLLQENNRAIRNLLWCGIFFGFAMATKWQGLYTAPVLLFCLIYCEVFRQRVVFRLLIRKVCFYGILLFIVPVSIYLLSYSSYFSHDSANNFVEFVLRLQKGMFEYHHSYALNVTHPYASNWWSWPLLIRPLSLYYWQNSAGLSSTVVLIGNPAIWWLGVITVPVTLILAIRKYDITAFAIILMIASLYMPWMFVNRLSFIYYFYAVTPFWIMSITYVLTQSWFKQHMTLVYSYLLIVFILFVMFYPVISGVPVPRLYTVNYLQWLPSWNF